MTKAVWAFEVSERRACSAQYVARSSQRYKSRKPDRRVLKPQLRDLALSRPRYGYLRLHVLLRREGWACQHRMAINFIQPSRPAQYGHIESFNGKLRDECLNTSWFTDVQGAELAIEAGGSTATK